MLNLLSVLPIVGAIVLLVVGIGVTAFGRRAQSRVRHGRSLADRAELAPSRRDLLRNGLRVQGTITDVRRLHTLFSSAQSRQHIVTVATAYDHDTGQMRRFTQHGTLLLGHRGDPVTVLIDPERPSVYLIMR